MKQTAAMSPCSLWSGGGRQTIHVIRKRHDMRSAWKNIRGVKGVGVIILNEAARLVFINI